MTLLASLVGSVGAWIQVVIGVGLLIFIHEAGHFLVAKWAKVRVEAFSLGFGPEMFGFTRGPTRYRVSWIPLGGYVKMAGETELEGGGYAPDDYPAQPVWVRSLIIVAGVAMNAVLGFVLFAGALLVGLEVDPVTVGSVAHGRPAWEAGIRPGDRLVAADGRRLVAFADLVYATMDGEPIELTVVRGKETLRIPVAPRADGGQKTPSIGVGPDRGSVIAAAAGGFEAGDRIVSVEGIPAGLSDFDDEVFATAVLPEWGPLYVTVRRGEAEVVVTVEPSGSVRRVGITPLATVVDRVRAGGPAGKAGWRPGDRPLAVAGAAVGGRVAFLRAAAGAPGAPVRVARTGGEADLPLPADPRERLELLRDLRFAPSPSPTAVEVFPGSPAAAAGMVSGAKITAVAGKAVAKFEDVVKRIAEVKTGAVDLEWTADGAPGKASIAPAELPRHGLSVETADSGEILRASSVGEAFSMAAGRCVITTRQIVTTVSGIFRGSVDKDQLGGPIMIAQVARRSTEEGIGHFLWLLGMLSINLMFLNILPIPVLDGGQLALLLVEAVTRRRPSEALVGIAQMTGLVLLLSLMVFVSFNDVLRLLR